MMNNPSQKSKPRSNQELTKNNEKFKQDLTKKNELKMLKIS